MCGRFVLDDTGGILLRFRIVNSEEVIGKIKPCYNISPSHHVYVVTRNARRENRLELMKWGLVPFWAKDPKIGNKIINTRVETITTKPSFKHIIKNRRCLVPVPGFYEWKKSDRRKTPYYIGLNDNKIFSFAGLYDIWKDSDRIEFKTFTIITTEANNTLKPIHNRMPIILQQGVEDKWLDTEIQEPDSLTRMLTQYPDEKMTAYEVSTKVNNPENDGWQLIGKVCFIEKGGSEWSLITDQGELGICPQ